MLVISLLENLSFFKNANKVVNVITFETFIKLYPRFQKYNIDLCAQELFLFLSQPEIVDRMIIVNDHAYLAALDGIVDELETRFAKRIDLKDQLDSRQMVGAMIKFILGQYGYVPDERVSIKNSKIFKLAMRYKFDAQEQKLELKKDIQIEKLKK